MSTPANAAEAPSIAKVWQQVKDNAPIFATIWGLILTTYAIDFSFSTSLSTWLYQLADDYELANDVGVYFDPLIELISTIGSFPTTPPAR